MRIYLFFLLILISVKAYASTKIVPEEILTKWGFKTISESENSQTIKGLNVLAIEVKSNWYARYTLSKECFNSEKSATKRRNEIETKDDELKGRFYGVTFIGGNCVYVFTSHAPIFKFYDKSNILKKFENYIRDTHNQALKKDAKNNSAF